MRIQRMRILAPLAALVVTGGCLENALEITNPNEPTVETFWETEEDAISGVNAVYRMLYEDGLYGRNRYWMWARTDAYMSRSPASSIQNAVRGIITDYNYGGFLGGMWEDPYRGIFRANQVINRVPEIDFDAELKARIIAEAKFLRALFYFEQVLLFGDIPIITEIIAGADQPAWSSTEEVYNLVIQDATEAAAGLPWTWSGDDVGRATRGAALAVVAESQMFLGQWDQAAATLQQIVDSGAYTLYPNFGGLFTLDEGEHNPESLFEVAFGDQNATTLGARGNVNPRLVGPSSGAGSSLGFNDIQPNQWAFEQFFVEGSYPDDPDPRLQYSIFWNKPGGMDVFGMPFAERYGTTGPGGGGGFRDTDLDHTYFFKKYQEYWKDELTDFANPVNVKVYRYGGILLMLAEALTETGQVAAAEVPLNQVRARVGLDPVPSGMSQVEMRDWINREFILELMWEGGNRFKYLKRHDFLTKEYLASRNPFHAAQFVNGKNTLIPIPQEEMDRNPNAVQNEGW